MMTADRNAEAIRDHHYWMGILMMLVSKQTIKMILLANCCVGEAEPAGQTVMERSLLYFLDGFFPSFCPSLKTICPSFQCSYLATDSW